MSCIYNYVRLSLNNPNGQLHFTCVIKPKMYLVEYELCLIRSELVLGREYRIRERVVSGLIHNQEYRAWIDTYLRIQRELYLD